VKNKTIEIKYYAIFREQAGRSNENLQTQARTASELYTEISKTYNFSLSYKNVKVSINEQFQNMETELFAGDSVVFIPPVAGG